jgi:hypothetical protein
LERTVPSEHAAPNVLAAQQSDVETESYVDTVVDGDEWVRSGLNAGERGISGWRGPDALGEIAAFPMDSPAVHELSTICRSHRGIA